MWNSPAVPSIAVTDVTDAMLLLDVRDPDEHAAARVDGSVHIPMMTLPDRLDELPRDQRVAVLCAVGGRSAQVTAWLVAQGYDAANVDGGISAWAAAGLPVVTGSH